MVRNRRKIEVKEVWKSLDPGACSKVSQIQGWLQIPSLKSWSWGAGWFRGWCVRGTALLLPPIPLPSIPHSAGRPPATKLFRSAGPTLRGPGCGRRVLDVGLVPDGLAGRLTGRLGCGRSRWEDGGTGLWVGTVGTVSRPWSRIEESRSCRSISSWQEVAWELNDCRNKEIHGWPLHPSKILLLLHLMPNSQLPQALTKLSK